MELRWNFDILGRAFYSECLRNSEKVCGNAVYEVKQENPDKMFLQHNVIKKEES